MFEDEFEVQIKGMLNDRAEGVHSAGDPVGRTRTEFRAAATRRRRAVTVTTAMAVTGGVALGAAAFGAAGSSGSRSAASSAASGGGTAAAAPTADATTKPTSDPLTMTPPGGQPCGSALKPIIRDVTKLTWTPRGSLAGDKAFTDALKSRTKGLVHAVDDLKVEFAGDDGTTRVAVVFFNPEKPQGCEKGMEAVVFHGPHGASAADLMAQAGSAEAGPNIGFTWAGRNTDGSMTVAGIFPSDVKTVSFEGSLKATTPSPKTSHSATDGALLVTLPADADVPTYLGTGRQVDGGESGTPLSFAVPAKTKSAFATAVGVDASKVGDKSDPGIVQDSFEYPIGVGYSAWPAVKLDGRGAETVQWFESSYVTNAYVAAHPGVPG